jgi:hypothetical protein
MSRPKGAFEPQPSADGCDHKYTSRDARGALYSPPLMVLTKLGEFTCARRAGTEMIDPGLRFLKREFARGNRFEDVGTRTTAPLRVWVAIKKRAPQRFSKSLFFILG